MPTSTSRLSYGDCFDLLDQALADPIGIAIGFERRGDAVHFRLRLNAARELDRKDNAETYFETPQHALFGRSQYDAFVFKLRSGLGKHYVLIERNTAKVMEVIPLSEIDEAQLQTSEVEWKKPVEVLKLTDRRV